MDIWPILQVILGEMIDHIGRDNVSHDYNALVSIRYTMCAVNDIQI